LGFLRRVAVSKRAWIGVAFVVVVLAVVLVIIGLRSAKPGEIVIGWVGPLTGQYASYGKMVREGTEIALKKVNESGGINGKKLVVVYEDDQLKPEKGIAAFNKLVSLHRAPVVIQAAGSNVMLAQAPIAERKHVVLISPTCTSPKISDAGDYVFRIVPSDVFQGGVIAETARRDLKAKTAAVLYINNDYGVGLKDVFLKRFAEAGGEVLAADGFDPNTKDFRTMLGRAKDAKPDVVFLSSLYQEAALILRQGKELGLSPQFIGGDGCFAPELIERAGGAAEGMVVVNMHWDPESSDPLVAKFVRAFKERTGKAPEVYAALGYDCLRIVADAIRRAGISPAAIKEALYRTKDFPGVTGPTSFDDEGDAEKQYDVFVVRSGSFVKKVP